VEQSRTHQEAREAARRSTPTRPPPAGDLGWGRRRRPVSGLIARTRFWAFCWGSGGVWNHSLSVTVLLELEGGGAPAAGCWRLSCRGLAVVVVSWDKVRRRRRDTKSTETGQGGAAHGQRETLAFSSFPVSRGKNAKQKKIKSLKHDIKRISFLPYHKST
jgi:hypothetical protein